MQRARLIGQEDIMLNRLKKDNVVIGAMQILSYQKDLKIYRKEIFMSKRIHKAKQRSSQHKRKHNPKSNHFNGLIIGKRSRYNGGLLNAFKK